jgi:hypothetical protein
MGVVIYVAIVQIPQRFITVNGMAPFDAAVRLLPFGAFIPVGSSVAAGLMGKPKMRPSHILIAGSALQIVGTVLLSRTSTSPEVHNTQYGYQILLGTGLGFVNGALTLLVPYVMENRDLGVLFCSERNATKS